MANPTCSSNCQADLAPVQFSDCNPVLAYSEIRRIFLAKSTAAPFADWTSATEWNTRLSETSITGDDYIRALTVIADKPAGAAVSKDISNGRKVTVGKDHTVNATIDDVSDLNYEFIRSLECGGRFKLWYETAGGKMYGGNNGIGRVNIDANDILNRGTEEIETFTLTATWRDKFHPERTNSPIFDGETIGGGSPGTFNTVQTFADAATKTTAGVTTTLAAVDPDAKFEFNSISSPAGTPQSMTIKIGASEQATIDFPNDYLGAAFRYTDVAGTAHTGVFTNGDVTF